MTLSKLGRLGEAEMLQKEVLEISRQAPGAENPDTLAAFEIYAPILSKLGRLGKAEPLQN